MVPVKQMLAAATLTAMAAVVSPALAADEGAAPQTAPAAAPRPQRFEDGVEARIKELHERLHVTEAQEGQWNAVAEVMRANAKGYVQLIKDKRKNEKTMTALEDLRAYQQIAEAHAEGVKKLSDAFETLYNAMSPEQRKVADEVFREHKRQFAARAPQ